ncbi:hypothetical protein DPEC_G00275850 [Dallia pectoralis]|uniref:Uncharacterized protein n=1 Tax=Dallia pectoralis TaxID=75939 RepID=A0ACC2FLS6_DALPE|nr:hypothetical protein DPEC_G00275850 [Dallia pectoralis]
MHCETSTVTRIQLQPSIMSNYTVRREDADSELESRAAELPPTVQRAGTVSEPGNAGVGFHGGSQTRTGAESVPAVEGNRLTGTCSCSLMEDLPQHCPPLPPGPGMVTPRVPVVTGRHTARQVSDKREEPQTISRSFSADALLGVLGFFNPGSNRTHNP